MRQYRSHKVVEAAQITRIEKILEGHKLELEGEAEPFIADGRMAARYEPVVGDYLVKYPPSGADLEPYYSYSPRAAFESGYTPSIGAQPIDGRLVGMSDYADKQHGAAMAAGVGSVTAAMLGDQGADAPLAEGIAILKHGYEQLPMPGIGRIVHWHPPQGRTYDWNGQPWPAMVMRVHSATCVDLAVFVQHTHGGIETVGFKSVERLVPGIGLIISNDSGGWSWPDRI